MHMFENIMKDVSNMALQSSPRKMSIGHHHLDQSSSRNRPINHSLLKEKTPSRLLSTPKEPSSYINHHLTSMSHKENQHYINSVSVEDATCQTQMALSQRGVMTPVIPVMASSRVYEEATSPRSRILFREEEGTNAKGSQTNIVTTAGSEINKSRKQMLLNEVLRKLDVSYI